MAIVSLDFIGDIANAAEGISAQYNTDFQQNQLAIAEAQARPAEATASGASAQPRSNMVIWGAVIAVIVIIAVLMMVKKK